MSTFRAVIACIVALGLGQACSANRPHYRYDYPLKGGIEREPFAPGDEPRLPCDAGEGGSGLPTAPPAAEMR